MQWILGSTNSVSGTVLTAGNIAANKQTKIHALEV